MSDQKYPPAVQAILDELRAIRKALEKQQKKDASKS
jgi:hypothetical protein